VANLLRVVWSSKLREAAMKARELRTRCGGDGEDERREMATEDGGGVGVWRKSETGRGYRHGFINLD